MNWVSGGLPYIRFVFFFFHGLGIGKRASAWPSYESVGEELSFAVTPPISVRGAAKLGFFYVVGRPRCYMASYRAKSRSRTVFQSSKVRITVHTLTSIVNLFCGLFHPFVKQVDNDWRCGVCGARYRNRACVSVSVWCGRGGGSVRMAAKSYEVFTRS